MVAAAAMLRRRAPPAVEIVLAASLMLALLPCPAVAARKDTSSSKSAAAAVAAASAVVFPLYGDVYPSGFFYVSMSIGNPPKPYFLDVDTGSDLTWIQCKPCVNCHPAPHPPYEPRNLVLCPDPLCSALHSTNALQESTAKRHCQSAKEQCDYEIKYADGSSLGVLVTDNFAVRLTNTSVISPSLAFGCGYDQKSIHGGDSKPSPTDGVLGLSSGAVSVLSQLRDQGITKSVIGHCISRKGGGYLFFGDDLVPYMRMAWAPMSRSKYGNYYSPGQANLFFGGRSIWTKQMDVVFDSGSSYTYFSAQPYQALVSAVKSDLDKSLREAPEEKALPLCWKGQKPFKSTQDIKKLFKPLVLSFTSSKKLLLEILPENYIIITKDGNACLGILNGSEVGLKEFNLIGDITMQDTMVVYDNEKNQIGWSPMACDRIPKAGGAAGLLDSSLPYYAGMGVLKDAYPSW